MDNMVVNTEVTRREDGCVLTLHFADGRIEERYLSAMEILDLYHQLDDALGETS